MSLLYLVILLVLVGVALYLIPMDQRIRTLIIVVVIVAAVLWLAQGLLGGGDIRIGR